MYVFQLFQVEVGFLLIESHSQKSSGSAHPKGSVILLYFQNVGDLSRYIIDTYDRLGSSLQYEIQQLLVESNGIPEEKHRIVSAHKAGYM